MSVEAITVSWVLNKAWVLLVGWWWYDKKKVDAAFKELNDKHQELVLSNSKKLEESQIKALIKEALLPMKEDNMEVKELLKTLNENVQALSRDMAVQNAIRSINHDTSQSTTG